MVERMEIAHVKGAHHHLGSSYTVLPACRTIRMDAGEFDFIATTNDSMTFAITSVKGARVYEPLAKGMSAVVIGSKASLFPAHLGGSWLLYLSVFRVRLKVLDIESNVDTYSKTG